MSTTSHLCLLLTVNALWLAASRPCSHAESLIRPSSLELLLSGVWSALKDLDFGDIAPLASCLSSGYP